MTPLVLQLQAEALDPNVRIADLLRKSKVVAVKLGLTEFGAWVENEINGYPDNQSLPDYRKQVGRLKARNPYQGWMPAIIRDREFELEVSTCYVTDPIGPLEETIRRSLEEEVGYVFHPLNGRQQAVLAEFFDVYMEFQVHVPAATAIGILDAVRNRVLDWSISLEQAGVLGEGMAFTVREREAARTMSNGNTYHIHGNIGVLGDVAHSTVHSTQSIAYSQADLTELRSVVDQISGYTGQLSGATQCSVVEALADARTELDAATPNHGRLRAALASIRTTCEGAAGNLIASGILGLITKFLS
jgi:hypothetical protein